MTSLQLDVFERQTIVIFSQKGLEAGIPLQPTSQKRAAALEAIEKLAENAEEEEEAGLIRKVSIMTYFKQWRWKN